MRDGSSGQHTGDAGTADDGLMTTDGVAFATVAAPWGPLRLAASDRSLVGLAVLAPEDAFVADVVRRTGLKPVHWGTRLLDRAVAAVEAFLGGRPAELEALPVEIAVGSEWDRTVLGAVRNVQWGHATSYGRVARAIGRRGAARAVGGAVGRNPIGLAIPCHRVVAGDGSIGGYGGDWFGTREALLDIKRELLRLEGIDLPVRDLPD
jgi:methylated-DNA-[protein]-cysteine S-methyltransferase